MKLKESITAPIAVSATYILYILCYRAPWVRDALLRSDSYDLLSGIVLELMILLIPALLYAKLKGSDFSGEMYFAALRPRGIIFAVCMTAGALAGVMLIAMLMNGIGLSDSRYLLTDTYAMTLSERDNSVFLRCVNYALIPAIGEELLFRGILVTEYRKSGLSCALIFSSVLFALSRFDLRELPAYLFLGLVLALIFYVTRSLPLTILSRLVLNLLLFYFEDAMWTMVLKHSIVVFLVCFCLIIILLAAALSLSEAQRLYYIRGIDAEPTPAEGKLKDSLRKRLLTAVLSPTFLLCVGIFAAVIGFSYGK